MVQPTESNNSQMTWRKWLYETIFEADTPAGKLFDVVLLLAIVLSVLVVMLESVQSIRLEYRRELIATEWFFTILFTLEYVLRLACTRRPLRYAWSFFGVIDLLAILPTYFMVLYPGAQRLTVIRSFRLLRAFRIFKLAHMLHEAATLKHAVWASRAKIAVFLAFVVIVVVIVGSAMHLIEGPESGFTSIPQSMYWAVVTMTTVGYGDIAPVTTLGKTLAAVVMVLGYSMIIVPTGIVTAELTGAARHASPSTQVCPECMAEGHDFDAQYCKYCGTRL
jgi:voltage-gated potassium channel